MRVERERGRKNLREINLRDSNSSGLINSFLKKKKKKGDASRIANLSQKPYKLIVSIFKHKLKKLINQISYQAIYVNYSHSLLGEFASFFYNKINNSFSIFQIKN